MDLLVNNQALEESKLGWLVNSLEMLVCRLDLWENILYLMESIVDLRVNRWGWWANSSDYWANILCYHQRCVEVSSVSMRDSLGSKLGW